MQLNYVYSKMEFKRPLSVFIEFGPYKQTHPPSGEALSQNTHTPYTPGCVQRRKSHLSLTVLTSHPLHFLHASVTFHSADKSFLLSPIF